MSRDSYDWKVQRTYYHKWAAQILSFDCHDVHAPTVPMHEFKMLLAITAARDETFHMDTTNAFLSAELKPGEVIKCNLEGHTRPAAMHCYWSKFSADYWVWFLSYWLWLHIVSISEQGYRWSDVTQHSRWRFLACVHLFNVGTGLCIVFWKEIQMQDERCSWICWSAYFRDRLARHKYLSQALLLDRLLEFFFLGIMSREGLTGDDLHYNLGFDLIKWEALCPCSTPFDYRMACIPDTDCPAVPDPSLIHWMQVTVCVLMYSLHTPPDIMHALHQLSESRIVHNLGPACIKALDHLPWYLDGNIDLVFVVGNWTGINRTFPPGFHGNTNASH